MVLAPTAEAPRGRAKLEGRLERLLRLMAERNASDVHMAVGVAPTLRVSSDLVPITDEPALTSADMERIFASLAGEAAVAKLWERKDMDFAFEAEGIGRFRVNAAVQRASICITIRRVHGTVPTIETLGLPAVCRALAIKPRGLVLVTGAVNSGKSTTMAAMIEYLNNTVARRIVTVEDPVEYMYAEGKCFITQRELGADVPSFPAGLKSALRQDPNVILVGEMRDPDTVAACLTAAETGHLVMSTLHTPSAAQAIDRIVDVFPSAQQPLVRHRLAGLLEGVIYQVLVPRKDGQGRVLAAEIMLGSPAVRALIREGRTHQIQNVVHTSLEAGMQTLDQALLKLHRAQLVTQESVMLYAANPEEVQRLLGPR